MPTLRAISTSYEWKWRATGRRGSAWARSIASSPSVLERAAGRRGAGRLRELAGYDATTVADARSELELLFADTIREAALPEPQRNVLVAGYEVDAFWPQARLVVELQGYEWHATREAFERDHAKRAALMAAGYAVLALTWRQLRHGRAEVIGTLRALLAPSERPAPAARHNHP
jgi:very-short-patch-repair endonuclease